MNEPADASTGLIDLAELINWHVGVWHDLGYVNPPTPECKTIPPLGERSTSAVKEAHAAIDDIDRLIARLHTLRTQLVDELREDSDTRNARTGARLARGTS